MPNYGFQRYNISRSLSGGGIDTEKFDLDAHIDRQLSMHENMYNIRQHHGLNVGSATRAARSQKTSRHQQRIDTRGSFYQIGRTHEEMDRRRPAKDPGVRRGPTGKRYTERRKNRSDRPGRRV